MQRDIELWEFIIERLDRNESVVLMVVADSSGSSPGRPGFKMAVAKNGFCGSIGGGVMEVALVDKAQALLGRDSIPDSRPVRQVHRKDSEHRSGMICSGEQTVIIRLLEPDVRQTIGRIRDSIDQKGHVLVLTADSIELSDSVRGHGFERLADDKFIYREQIRRENDLFIVGGGHCALALSEVMSRLGFRVTVFDDRTNLNTVAKNEFADNLSILESYEGISDVVPAGVSIYVVVMTIGYKYDKVVIRKLLGKDFRYFGVLGSKAKMAVLIKELKDEGYDELRLDAIHTPIGIDINSRTPEEIAVSIAAEIISIKNGDRKQ